MVRGQAPPQIFFPRTAMVINWLFCSQEQICEMYQGLYECGQQDLLSRFEDILVTVIKDVRKQQCDKDRLEQSYQRSDERFTLSNYTELN